MKYLCLVYADDAEAEHPDATTPTRTHSFAASALVDFADDLVRSGHALLFAAVPPAATTLQIRHGAVALAEPERSAERLIACYLIQARDLNEAIRVSGRMPGLHTRRIEVRPVLECHTKSG